MSVNNPTQTYEIIYFMKPKLLPVDTFMPFFCNGKKLGMFKKASVFVFASDFKESIICTSTFNQKMLSSLGINVFDYSLGEKVFIKNKFVQKIIVLLMILAVLVKPSKHQKVIFGSSDVSGVLAKILSFFVKKMGILSCTFKVSPHTQTLMSRAVKSNGKRNNEVDVNVDLILSSCSLRGEIPEDKLSMVRHVGYGRAYMPWWDAVNQFSRESVYPELPTKDFIYWPLNVLYRNNNGLGLHVGDGVLDLLSGLAALTDQPLIVFRYHPTTDKAQFNRILEKSGYRNFIISDEHSNVLIERCKLVVSTIGTSVFVDANFRKKPCMLYVSPETLKGKSDGIFDELVFEDFSQFVVFDNLNLARELVQASAKELLKSREKNFFNFKHDVIMDEEFLRLFDTKVH